MREMDINSESSIDCDGAGRGGGGGGVRGSQHQIPQAGYPQPQVWISFSRYELKGS